MPLPPNLNFNMQPVDALSILWSCKDFELLIIRCQILIEQQLVEFINAKTVAKSSHDFSFAQKIEISRMLGLFLNDKPMSDDLKTLKDIRNDLAHGLTYNSNHVATYIGNMRLDKNLEIGIDLIFDKGQMARITYPDGSVSRVSQDFFLFAAKSVRIINNINIKANS